MAYIALLNLCPSCGCHLPYLHREALVNQTQRVTCCGPECGWTGEILPLVSLEKFLSVYDQARNLVGVTE